MLLEVPICRRAAFRLMGRGVFLPHPCRLWVTKTLWPAKEVDFSGLHTKAWRPCLTCLRSCLGSLDSSANGRSFPLHFPSNRQTGSRLPNCRGWADCITVTLARPAEDTGSLPEKVSTRMGGQPPRLPRDELQPFVPRQIARRRGRCSLSIRPIALRCSRSPRTDANVDVSVKRAAFESVLISEVKKRGSRA